MRQLWLPPERLAFSFYLGQFLTVYSACIGLPFGASEETLLLGRPLNKPGPTRLGWKSSGHVFTSCYGWAPHRSQGPPLTDEFYPHKSNEIFWRNYYSYTIKKWNCQELHYCFLGLHNPFSSLTPNFILLIPSLRISFPFPSILLNFIRKRKRYFDSWYIILYFWKCSYIFLQLKE